MNAETIRNRNILLVQLYTLSWNAMFLLPVILSYYKNQLGLSFQQFVLGEVMFAAVVMLMEVPSGWLADMWGRKKTLVVAALLMAAGWAILLLGGGFWMAALAQCVIGVGVSMKSGTDTALIYETLQEAGQTHKSRAAIGLQRGLGMYACAFAALVGGFMYGLNPFLPLYATIGMQVVTLASALLLREPKRHTKAMEKHPLHDIAVTVHEAVIKRRELGFLMLGAALLFGSTKYAVWAQQSYWGAMHLDPAMNGLLAALGWGISGLAGQFGHHIEHRLGYRATFVTIWVALCMAWLFAGLHLGWAGVWGLYLGSIAFSLGSPALEDAINQKVSSERRATIISTASLLMNLMFMPIGTVASWVADNHGVQESLLVLAGFHITLGVIAAAGFRHARKLALI